MIRSTFGALLLLMLALLAGAPRAALAAESYDNCTGFITSLPAVITTQGTWCLKQDVNTAITTGNAITIATNNVILDCNDFKIGGLAAGVATEAYGIAAGNRLNITVRHCNVRGFFIGTGLWGKFSSGNTVEDNRFDNNTYIGLQIAGDGSTARRNRVLDTGGSTVASTTGGAVGIYSQYYADVLDNTVSGVAATSGTDGDVAGISVQFSDVTLGSSVGSSIDGNRVRGLSPAGTGTAGGIISFQTQRLVLRNNDLVGDSSAGSATGIACYASDSHAKENVINGFATGIFACSDDGNVIAP